MKNFRPYVAIDSETTGLDIEKSQILEFAAIYDDLETPVEKLPYYHTLVHYDCVEYGEFQALSMNKELLFQLSRPHKAQPPAKVFEGLVSGFVDFITEHQHLIKTFEDSGFIEGKNPDYRVHLAGKAAATFDWPLFINQMRKRLDPRALIGYMEFLEKNVHFWVMDVGSMYVTDFLGYIPPMNHINQMLRRPKVSHKALDDARDVVCAIRHKFGVPY